MDDLYKKQEIILRDRTKLTISGIVDVTNFDEIGIILSSVNGEISIDGSELKILNLSSETGEIEISGKIGGIFYLEDRPSKRRFFGKRT